MQLNQPVFVKMFWLDHFNGDLLDFQFYVRVCIWVREDGQLTLPQP